MCHETSAFISIENVLFILRGNELEITITSEL